ncbi:cyclic nucleotide-binding domain-containing protein [Sulfurimonas sp.]|nr:cyclic nucleotide-binding domain-containing protein [Sulfurimonas sp.]
MIQQVEYDIDDVEEFLEVTKLSQQDENSQTLQKLLNVQSKISIIANIDPEELKVIIDKLTFVKYNFKDFIIAEGDISQEIFFILSGECQVFHNNKKIGEIKAGSTFGESAAIFNTKRNASVVCSSKEVTVLSFCIDHDNMDFCAPALAKLYKNLALQINTKLEETNNKLIKK